MHVTDDELKKAGNFISEFMDALEGQPPQIIGTVLGQMSAIFLASFEPRCRAEQRDMLFNFIDGLVPVMIRDLIADGRVGEEWKDGAAKIQ